MFDKSILDVFLIGKRIRPAAVSEVHNARTSQVGMWIRTPG
jgi:hypothetical protein